MGKEREVVNMELELKDHEYLTVRYKNVELVVQAFPPMETELRVEQYPRILVVGSHNDCGQIVREEPRFKFEDEEGVIFKRT